MYMRKNQILEAKKKTERIVRLRSQHEHPISEIPERHYILYLNFKRFTKTFVVFYFKSHLESQKRKRPERIKRTQQQVKVKNVLLRAKKIRVSSKKNPIHW